MDDPTRRGSPDTGPPTAATRPGESAITGGAVETRPEIPPPVDLAGYVIEAEIGRGGMGVVYRARQLGLNRAVAVKMVRGRDRADDKEIIRFLAEAEAVAAIRHPHVVQVYEYGERDGRPFLAMEYCGGGSLAARLKGNGLLAPLATANLISRLAEAVHAAHTNGIVHRDLKPGNVLFDDAGEPKVTDFGLAKRHGGGSDLTRTNAVIGTPAYMAPEQAKGESKFVGPQADVWALGVILYECVTGRRPFDSEDSWSVLHKVMSEDPVPPRTRVPGVPRDLELICLKCLQKDPADRYPTARALADDLDNFRAGRPITARPASIPERLAKWARRNPLPAALTAAVVLMTVGLTAALFVLYRSAADQARTEGDLRKNAERLADENASLARAEQDRRREADAELARANEVTDFLAGLFQSSDPLDIFGKDILPASWEQEQRLTARDFLDRAAERFKTGLTDQPLVRARLLRTIGSSYSNLGLFAKARPLLEESLAIFRANLPPDHPELAQIEFDMGRLQLDLGDTVGAEARFRTALEIRQRGHASEAAIAATKFHLAYAMTMSGNAGAEPLFREVIATRERLFGPHDAQTTQARVGFASFLLDQIRPNEIPLVVKQIADDLDTLPPGQVKDVVRLILEFQGGLMLAFAATNGPELLREVTLDQAEKKLRASVAGGGKVLPKNQIFMLLFRWMLARVLDYRGKDADAAAEYATNLAGIRSTIGLAHPRAVWFVDDYATFLARTGKADEGRKLLAEADAANLDRFGPDNLWRSSLLLRRIEFEGRNRGTAAAVRFAKEEVELIKKGRLTKSRHTAVELLNAAEELPWDTAPVEADALFAAAGPMMAESFGPRSEQTAWFLRTRFEFLWHRQRWAEAAEVARREEAEVGDALSVRARAAALIQSGEVERARGNFAAAEERFRKAVALARSNGGVAYNFLDVLLVRLAGAVVEQGRFTDAVPLLGEAEKVASKRKNATEPMRAEWAYLTAAAKLGAGDRAGYRETVKDMAKRFGGSADATIVQWLIQAAGLADGAAEYVPASATKRPAAGLPAERATAIFNLRGPDPGRAVPAGGEVATSNEPADVAICGLAALWRGRRAEARKQLARAEQWTAARAPTPEKPFAFAGEHWSQRMLAGLLTAELKRSLTETPAAAPPPRPVE
jgi:tetratricopeptide (TPR) repeat protein/tRNA A-37 threonylcarbamoyl transferase component Bud32